MHLQRLDLNLLIALDALLTEQSVTKAAQRTHVSQPAMSGALTRLREHFQDELMVRVGRSMVLTPFGAGLVPRVTELLARITSVVTSRPGFDPTTTDRTFTITASEYLLAVFAPLVTTKILAAAPGASLNIQLRSHDHEQRMAMGHIDAALGVGGLTLPQHPCTPLFSDEYVCVACKDNQDIGETLSLAQFLAAPQAMRAMSRDNSLTLEDAWLQQQGFLRKVALLVPSFDTLPRMVIGSRMIAPMQRRLAEMSAAALPIRILPHPAAVPPLVAMLQWPLFRQEDPGSRWLRELIVATAREAFGEPPAMPQGGQGTT